MKTFLKALIIVPTQYFENLFFRFYYTLIFKFKNIEYNKRPTINGKLVIYNNGRCVFGDSLKFNSSVQSNMVGLFKVCTIYVSKNAQLVIGDSSGFSGVSVYCSKQIHIGRFVNCGGNVSIWDTDFHPLSYEARRVHEVGQIVSKPISIGDDVFIGANSIILKGVTIGDRSIIGAGSVVTGSIPSDEIWAGNPARFIRKIIDN